MVGSKGSQVFEVHIVAAGRRRMELLRVIREVGSSDLADAKRASYGGRVLRTADLREAERAVALLEEAGAQAEVRPTLQGQVVFYDAAAGVMQEVRELGFGEGFVTDRWVDLVDRRPPAVEAHADAEGEHARRCAEATGTRAASREEAFLALSLRSAEHETAVLEDPADESAWRVYADWLLERGDPRGGYVQSCLRDGAYWQHLRPLKKALLGPGMELRPHLGPAGHADTVELPRSLDPGFVLRLPLMFTLERVELDARQVGALLAAPWPARLDTVLVRFAMDHEGPCDLDALARHTRQLTLHGWGMPEAALRSERLEHLELALVDPDASLRMLAQAELPRLERLVFGFPDDGLFQYDEVPWEALRGVSLPALREATFHGPRPPAWLLESPSFRDLERLVLSE